MHICFFWACVIEAVGMSYIQKKIQDFLLMLPVCVCVCMTFMHKHNAFCICFGCKTLQMKIDSLYGWDSFYLSVCDCACVSTLVVGCS